MKRHSAEAADEIVVCYMNDAEAFAERVAAQDERGERVGAAVRSECGAQVYVGDDLAVDSDEGVLVEKGAGVGECAARAEYFRFLEVVKVDVEAFTAAECVAHRVALVMQIDGDLATAVAREILRRVADERTIEEWHGWFRAVSGKGPEARAVTGGEDHRVDLCKIVYLIQGRRRLSSDLGKLDGFF